MHAQLRDGAQMVEGDLVRVAIGVADPDRDERRPRARGVEQWWAAARSGAMMADLQHVDPRQQAAFSQRRLDGRLGIPGEQGREAATA